MKEIRLHGRGGQGTVMASRMLAKAFVMEGNYATALPTFGAERRGTPVSAFVRVDSKPIRERTWVYFPDCLVFMDPVFNNSAQSFQRLKSNGILILNSANALESTINENIKTAGVVDATRIALEEIELPVPNTCIVGAFAATTGWVSLDSLLLALKEDFSGSALQKNIRCTWRGFEEVQITKF